MEIIKKDKSYFHYGMKNRKTIFELDNIKEILKAAQKESRGIFKFSLKSSDKQDSWNLVEKFKNNMYIRVEGPISICFSG